MASSQVQWIITAPSSSSPSSQSPASPPSSSSHHHYLRHSPPPSSSSASRQGVATPRMTTGSYRSSYQDLVQCQHLPAGSAGLLKGCISPRGSSGSRRGQGLIRHLLRSAQGTQPSYAQGPKFEGHVGSFCLKQHSQGSLCTHRHALSWSSTPRLRHVTFHVPPHSWYSQRKCSHWMLELGSVKLKKKNQSRLTVPGWGRVVLARARWCRPV